MRVLLSAYACEPEKGSEPGVGWHWATELARLGHEVVVITRSNNRVPIERAMAECPIIGLRFQYYDLPSWAKWWKRGNRGIHLYYRLWQYGAFRLGLQLTHEMQFDLVHHLTFGGGRMPSFMGRLGLPFVIGPLGGGDVTPALLLRTFPAREAFEERLREASNKLSFLDPPIVAMYKQATLIFCKTKETLALLPAACRQKGLVQLEIGLEPHRIKREITARAASADFLYVGNLLPLKGIHLALKALSELRRTLPKATLTIIGSGTDEGRLKKLAAALNLRDSVQWLGWIPQGDLWAHYSRYTAFVFPSMHDSSGNVVLEAFSQALPVICLDTGGPGAIVPPSCGIKVEVKNRNEAEVVGDLAVAMQTLADNPDLCARMGLRALEVARENTWKNVVSSAYAHIENRLDSARECGMDSDRRRDLGGNLND